MCEYCTGNKRKMIDLGRNFGKARISKSYGVDRFKSPRIIIYGYFYWFKNHKKVAQMKINYCPMCGRDLKATNATAP